MYTGTALCRLAMEWGQTEFEEEEDERPEFEATSMR